MRCFVYNPMEGTKLKMQTESLNLVSIANTYFSLRYDELVVITNLLHVNASEMYNDVIVV